MSNVYQLCSNTQNLHVMKLIHRLLDDYAFEGIKGQKSDLKPNHSVQSPTHSSPTMKLTKKWVFSSINQFGDAPTFKTKTKIIFRNIAYFIAISKGMKFVKIYLYLHLISKRKM